MKWINKKYLLRLIILLSKLSIILPIFAIVIWSISKNYRWPNIFPSEFGFRAWEYVLKNNTRILISLGNSIFISSITTFITILISIPCAKVLAFKDFRWKKFIELMIFLPVIIPPVSMGMGLNIEFIRLGLARTYTGVILVSIVPAIPYAVRMLKEVFIIVGEKYVQQAYILGGSKFITFKKITLPMILPGIVSASIMCYIVSFSQYFLVYLIGGGKIITFTMDMFPFIQSGDRMMASVYSLIFILSTIFSLALMEYLMKKTYMNKLKGYNYI